MKVAVAFFGIPRNARLCQPSIEAQILAGLRPRVQLRTFYHLYRQSHVVSRRSGEDAPLSPDNYEPFAGMEGVYEAPGPCLQRWGFDRLCEFGDAWDDDFVSLRNLVHQLNSLDGVMDVIDRSAFEPDVVIFVRPDLLFHDALPLTSVQVARHDPRIAYVPDWQWWSGLNDRYAVCGKQAARWYGRRVREMLDYCHEKSAELHSEQLLKYALLRHGARVLALHCKASRVRVSGQIVDEDFSHGRRPMGRENRLFYPLTRFRTWRVESRIAGSFGGVL